MKRVLALAAAVMMTASPSAFAVQQVVPGVAGYTDMVQVALPNVNNFGPGFTESASGNAAIYVNCVSRVASIVANGFVNNYTNPNREVIIVNNALSSNQSSVSPGNTALSADIEGLNFINTVCPNANPVPTVFYSAYGVTVDATPGFTANDRQAYAALIVYYTF